MSGASTAAAFATAMAFMAFMAFMALAIAGSMLTPAPASAQQSGMVQLGAGAQSSPAAAPSDDVQWESREEPWLGGPVRPGAELGARVNGWVPGGITLFVGGYLLALVGLDPRPGSMIPIAGPFLAATGVFDEEPWSDGETIAMIISGVLQVGGLTAMILGLLNPKYFVVYDAPVGSPSWQVGWAPAADRADVGVTVSVRGM